MSMNWSITLSHLCDSVNWSLKDSLKLSLFSAKLIDENYDNDWYHEIINRAITLIENKESIDLIKFKEYITDYYEKLIDKDSKYYYITLSLAGVIRAVSMSYMENTDLYEDEAEYEAFMTATLVSKTEIKEWKDNRNLICRYIIKLLSESCKKNN
jgi:hypothetical protein